MTGVGRIIILNLSHFSFEIAAILRDLSIVEEVNTGEEWLPLRKILKHSP